MIFNSSGPTAWPCQLSGRRFGQHGKMCLRGLVILHVVLFIRDSSLETNVRYSNYIVKLQKNTREDILLRRREVERCTFFKLHFLIFSAVQECHCHVIHCPLFVFLITNLVQRCVKACLLSFDYQCTAAYPKIELWHSISTSHSWNLARCFCTTLCKTWAIHHWLW